MKLYLLSLGAGVLVGVIYHLIGVRSPAPPLVALDVMLTCVRWYVAYPLSLRHLEE